MKTRYYIDILDNVRSTANRKGKAHISLTIRSRSDGSDVSQRIDTENLVYELNGVDCERSVVPLYMCGQRLTLQRYEHRCMYVYVS